MCAILAALLFRWLHKRTFNPATIFLGMLGLQLAIYTAMAGTIYSQLSAQTLFAVSSSLLGFLVGYTLFLSMGLPITLRWLGKRQLFLPLHPRTGQRLFRFALVSSLVAAAWHTWSGMSNIADGATGDSLLDLRLVYLENLDSFGLAPHVAIFAQFLLLYLYLSGYRQRVAMTLMVIVTIYCAIWKMERSAIIMAGFSALTAIEMQQGALPFKKFALVLLAAVGIFGLVASLRDGWDSATDILFLMLDYFAKNLQNFETFVVGRSPIGGLDLLLGKYATTFGAATVDQSIGQDDYFNTYSYLRQVYMFGGAWFCPVFGFIVGAVSSIFYNFGVVRNHALATIYCFVAFALFLTFFDYAFSWTNWAYYVISAVLVQVLIKKNRVKITHDPRAQLDSAALAQ